MRSALYYPHTQMKDEALLKNALLLWDEVEFISPTSSFDFEDSLPKHIVEGLELLCKAHVPTDTERRTAHARIVKLLSKGIPNWLVATEVPESIKGGRKVREFYGREYGMYPQKLDLRTWDLLEGAGLVQLSGEDYDYYTRPLVGLYLMSILADVCAGATKEKITDRSEAYSFLWTLIAAEGSANEHSSITSKSAATMDRLVTISLKTIGTEAIPFKNILDLRKREAGRQGHDYRAFRKKYGEKINEYAVLIANQVKTKRDRDEIERQFKIDMQDDLASLKDELRVETRQLKFSTEVITTVVVAGGVATGVTPISELVSRLGGLVTGGFMKDAVKAQGNYKSALKNHSSSWLYLAEDPIRDLPFRDLGEANSP
jgi:hypothetical protein